MVPIWGFDKIRVMEKGERFSEYLFAKMGPGDRGPKTTEERSAPVEPTGFRKWFVDNMMLVVTLAGVLTGIAIGTFFRLFILDFRARTFLHACSPTLPCELKAYMKNMVWYMVIFLWHVVDNLRLRFQFVYGRELGPCIDMSLIGRLKVE